MTSNFTYGDSTKTGDDKYVIAQFPSDTPLGWVVDLRSFLNLPELKYKFFEPKTYLVQSKPDLWKAVSDGVYRADITITDPRVYKRAVMFSWLDKNAEWGIDFDEHTVNEEAGEWMIQCSPLGLAQSMSVDWQFQNPDLDEFIDFSASAIKERAGGKLSDALVISARSHAMLTPEQTKQLHDLCRDGSVNYGLGLAQIARICRIWDVEHPKSLPILNDFSDQVSFAFGGRGRRLLARKKEPSVSEQKSDTSDHLQAADMAAGWAAQLLTLSNGDYRSLAQRFASVCVNGIVYPG